MRTILTILLSLSITAAQNMDVGAGCGAFNVGAMQGGSDCTIPTITNPPNDTVYCHSSGKIHIECDTLDSLHWIGTKPDSAVFIGKDTIQWWATKILAADTFKFSAHNVCGIDTGFFVRRQVWDTLSLDSVSVWYSGAWHKLSNGDTLYRSDSLFRHIHSNGWDTLGGWNWPGAKLDSLYTGDSADTRGDSTKYGIASRVHPQAASRWVSFYTADSVGRDTLKTGGVADSFYLVASERSFDSSNITVTQTAGGTVSLDPPGGRYRVGDTVTITATDTGCYHFVRWGDTVTDSSGNPLTFVVGDSDVVVSAVFGLDTFSVTLNADAHAPITRKGDQYFACGEACTTICIPDSGYAVSMAGRAYKSFPAMDTMIWSVGADSTVASVAVMIPVIDSIVCHVRRDSRLNCGRRLDTITIKLATDIGDSTGQDTIWLGRDTTGVTQITRWFNNSIKDSIWCIIPNTATLNVNYRPTIKVKGVYSVLRTPTTWREQWILNVKGQVR